MKRKTLFFPVRVTCIDKTDSLFMNIPICDGSLGKRKFQLSVTVPPSSLLLYFGRKHYLIPFKPIINSVLRQLLKKNGGDPNG